MPLEDANFISELNPNWPLGTDPVSAGDDHARVTKKAVQQSFPNVDKEVTATADDMNGLAVPGALMPTGAILSFASTSAPAGYLLCDGAAIDPQYTDLIALIGPNTPDLRGQFIRGWSDDIAQDPDAPRAPLSVQADDFKAHTHGIRVSTVGGSTSAAQGNPQTGSIQSDSAGGSETRPKNVAVAFIIKT